MMCKCEDVQMMLSRLSINIMKYFILGLMCFLASCAGNDKALSIAADTVEYIGDVKINGAINFSTTYKNVLAILGNEDSTSKENHAAYYYVVEDDDIKYLYFKGWVFERYGDNATLRSIDFKRSPNAYLLIDNRKINNQTTLKDVKKWYPKSVEKGLPGTDLDKYRGVVVESCKQCCAEQWLLYFDENKNHLIKMEYIDDQE